MSNEPIPTWESIKTEVQSYQERLNAAIRTQSEFIPFFVCNPTLKYKIVSLHSMTQIMQGVITELLLACDHNDGIAAKDLIKVQMMRAAFESLIYTITKVFDELNNDKGPSSMIN